MSLWEAKLHLRVDFDEDDMLIASLITAARQAAETLTGRQFTTARWKQVLDCFPGPSLMGVPAGQAFSLLNSKGLGGSKELREAEQKMDKNERSKSTRLNSSH